MLALTPWHSSTSPPSHWLSCSSGPAHSEHPRPSSFSFSTRVGVARQRRKTAHTHLHPAVPLRLFRMSLFTSWSVQVAGKHSVPLWPFLCCPDLRSSAALLHNYIICKFQSRASQDSSPFGLLSYWSSQLPEPASIWAVADAECCQPLSPLCVSNRSIASSAPPSNFDVIIDSSHLPPTQRLEEPRRNFWIALTFALHMLSGFTAPGAKPKRHSLALGCVTARQRRASSLLRPHCG